MTTKAEIQALLRFLSQDAKVPLPTAMAKIKDLQQAELTSAEKLAKSNLQALQTVFGDEKVSKQVLNAAKRLSKKRAAGDTDLSSPEKRKKVGPATEFASPAVVEASLALPSNDAQEQEVYGTVLYTNRAPLVLAFAVVLLKHTMPSQPLSSRLSLAQAVVSINSRSKAPTVKIMGREIRVMKRWGYDPNEGDNDTVKLEEGLEDSQSTIKDDGETLNVENNVSEEQPALWGLDLEALRAANGPLVTDRDTSKLPIYTPQSARAYLIKSFASSPSSTRVDASSPNKKPTAAAISAAKEQNLGMLLRALEVLYSSWVGVLSPEELDRRAWSWYIAVRPEVESGVAGWGGKGEVKLAQLLDMRRKG